MSKKFEFRSVFNKESVTYTAAQIKNIYPIFQEDAFINSVMDNFEVLSFGERMKKITQGLYDYLPKAFVDAQRILVDALGPPIKTQELEGYEGFYVMPMAHYIALYGTASFDLSMNALYEMTQRFTSEFAIRTFLLAHETRTLEILLHFAQDANPHVRRLVSEGSRPRLPMAQRLHPFIENPNKVFTLLEALKNEPTRLVQRSIANNLNDIAKDHPDTVTTFLKKWKNENVTDIDWIISHATRSLVKEGHLPTLELLGYNPDIPISHATIEIENVSIKLGDTLIFNADITLNNTDTAALIIDYLLYFKKANGTHKPKVFKLAKRTISPHTHLVLKKRHPLKLSTTRAYYEGVQYLQLQINGKPYGPKVSFELHM